MERATKEESGEIKDIESYLMKLKEMASDLRKCEI